jgi:putative FmdB family regulatory protein
MPLYEFKCREHGVFEKIVPTDTKRTPCPKCVEGNRQYAETKGMKPSCRPFTQETAPRVEQEIPARRNPIHGIQR